MIEGALEVKHNGLRQRLLIGVLCGTIGAAIIAMSWSYLRTPKNVREFMRAISKLDTAYRKTGASTPQQYDEIDASIGQHLSSIQDPLELKILFYACEQKKGYVFFQGQTHALFKLASMKSDSGARILAELLGDTTLAWDGESALNIYQALVECGEPCVPYLVDFSGANAALAQKALAAIQGATGATERRDPFSPAGA